MKRALFAILLLACGGGAETPTDAGGEAAASQAHVRGAIVDAAGRGWSNAKIQVCSATVCTLGDATTTGAFDVAVPSGDRYHVIARPGPGDSRDGSAGIGVLAAPVASDTSLATPVVLPVTGVRIPLGDATVAAVTPDLTLTASASDLEFSGDSYVAAVRVDPAAWPAFSIPGTTILAMWALNPWGTRASAGKTIAVTIQNSFSIADAASIYTLDEGTAELGPESKATPSADGTTLAATIDRLTWIVLAH